MAGQNKYEAGADGVTNQMNAPIAKDKLLTVNLESLDKKNTINYFDNKNLIHFVDTNPNLFFYINQYLEKSIDRAKINYKTSAINDEDIINDDYELLVAEIDEKMMSKDFSFTNFPFYFIRQLEKTYIKNKQKFPVISDSTIYLVTGTIKTLGGEKFFDDIEKDMAKNNPLILNRIKYFSQNSPKPIREELKQTTLLAFNFIQEQLKYNSEIPIKFIIPRK